MRPAKPAATKHALTRPPEPLRPEPARRVAIGLLAARARRRRYGPAPSAPR